MVEEVEEKRQVREWYVRLENLSGREVSDTHIGYKRLITYSDMELSEAILIHFMLPLRLKERMRIFSSPFRMRRLDRLMEIPLENVFVSVYFL